MKEKRTTQSFGRKGKVVDIRQREGLEIPPPPSLFPSLKWETLECDNNFLNPFQAKVPYCFKVSVNPFHANVPFLYSLKTSENQRFKWTKGFLTFSGGIEMGHWREKGSSVVITGEYHRAQKQIWTLALNDLNRNIKPYHTCNACDGLSPAINWVFIVKFLAEPARLAKFRNVGYTYNVFLIRKKICRVTSHLLFAGSSDES